MITIIVHENKSMYMLINNNFSAFYSLLYGLLQLIISHYSFPLRMCLSVEIHIDLCFSITAVEGVAFILFLAAFFLFLFVVLL